MADTVGVDAERVILGAVLLNNKTFPETLKLDDLSDLRHKTIFEAMTTLNDKGEPIDLVTLRKALGPSVDRAGGIAYLASLSDGIPATENVSSWVKIVKEDAALRSLDNDVSAVQRLIAEGSDSVAVLAVMEQAASNYRERLHIRGGPKKLSEFTKPVLVALEEEQEGKDSGTIKSGFRDLDEMIGGFNPGDLVVLAAATGGGKSSLAANIAVNCGKPTLFISLEMSGKLIAKRMLFSEAKINPARTRIAGIDDMEWDRLGAAFGVLEKVPIWIDDGARNPAMVRTRAMRMKEKHGLGLVVVDYLQLMSMEGFAGDNRAREVGKMSGDLKNLAMELDIPIIAISQFSRAVVQRKDKRPVLSDLKESGQIENDSDLALFLYREDGIVGTRTELIVAKNRSGPSGMIYLDFDKETTTFRNAIKQEIEA